MTQISKDIQAAVELLNQGLPVAIPTETVYGLAADARNAEAVSHIFQLKNRPSDNPLIVHVLPDEAEVWAKGISPMAQDLMNEFWPGPLTLVLNSKGSLPNAVTAGLSSIALRSPNHPVMVEVLKESGMPLAAPSANKSGRPSPTTAKHVLVDMDGELELIIDGGQCEHGLESTVIDVRGEQAILLRPGSLTSHKLNAFLSEKGYPMLEEKRQNDETVRSPGVKYRHYSPKAKLQILGDLIGFEPGSTLLILKEPQDNDFPQVVLGEEGKEWAHSLFAAFREADEKGFETILVDEPPKGEYFEALMNRIEKAIT